MVCNKDCFNCIFDDCILDEEKEMQKTYYQQNAERYKANARRWQKEHPDRVREIQAKANKKWFQKNKKHRAEYMKQYYRMKKEQAND